MSAFGPTIVEHIVALTDERISAVISAFGVLLRHSWNKPALIEAVALAEKQRERVAACKSLLAALDAAHAEFPTSMFWWKNERSQFLGCCPRFAKASGLPASELLGKTDIDPAVAWSRQGALYMKDDREVVALGTPRLDIVERQDRPDGTVWLRTSKVPYHCAAGAGTVGGFDTISAARARQLARK